MTLTLLTVGQWHGYRSNKHPNNGPCLKFVCEVDRCDCEAVPSTGLLRLTQRVQGLMKQNILCDALVDFPSSIAWLNFHSTI